MALYSKEYRGGNKFRTVYEHPAEVTSTIKIPAGKQLTTTDKLYFMKLGPDLVPLSVTLRSDDVDSGTTLTLNCGFEAAVATDDPDAFIAASTIGQAGGIVRVENGGDDPFAAGAFTAKNEVIDILAVPNANATGGPAADSYITCTVRFVKKNYFDFGGIPYAYKDRYGTNGTAFD